MESQHQGVAKLGVSVWSSSDGTFTTNCHPIVEELPASVKNHEVSSIAVATSVLRGLRRALAEITAIDDVKLDRRWKRSLLRREKCVRIWTSPV